MTNEQCAYLGVSCDAEFSARATGYGFDVVGPSKYGSYLIREPNGRAWLFGPLRSKFGRTVVESVWTENNIAVVSGVASLA